MLPDGGRVLVDRQLRGLDLDMELSLPFPVIAMEYRVGNQKRISLASETGSGIVLQHLLFDAKNDNYWVPTCEIILPRIGFAVKLDDGTCVVTPRPTDPECPPFLSIEPAAALLAMLNALACANVHIERSEPKRTSKRPKAALPFDSYHVLTIDCPQRPRSAAPETGEHRSPREHLRRGHIRRISDGRRVWVNATVVATGCGAGIVTKDYALRAAQ